MNLVLDNPKKEAGNVILFFMCLSFFVDFMMVVCLFCLCCL